MVAISKTLSSPSTNANKATKLPIDKTPLNLKEAARRNAAKHSASYVDDGSNMTEEQKIAIANGTHVMALAHDAVVKGAKQTERGRAFITATMVSLIRLELVPPLTNTILDSGKARNSWLTSFMEVIGQDYEAIQTAARDRERPEERAYVQALRDSQTAAAFLIKRNMVAFKYTTAPENAAIGEYRSLGMTKTGEFILDKSKLPGIVEGSGVSGTDLFSVSAIMKMARKPGGESSGETMLLRRVNSLKEELNKGTLTRLTDLERNALNLLKVAIDACLVRVAAQMAADKANAEKVANGKRESAERAAAAQANKAAENKAGNKKKAA